MSGTSLDGLDIAYCEFSNQTGEWDFSLGPAITIGYTEEFKSKLRLENNLSSEALLKNDVEFGGWCGLQVKNFIEAHSLNPDFIASHGHTIFHQPDQKFTCQIGNGQALMTTANCPVINDFRTLDVSLGGQGAPLVPIGDDLLFGKYDYCLNLGGIANFSSRIDKEVLAWDICPANMVLDFLAKKLGKQYDNEGAIAASGNVDEVLLAKLNDLDFYKANDPKSLGYEWVSQSVFPLLSETQHTIPDLLATFVTHIAHQIGRTFQSINTSKTASILVTGGGAFNDFLISKIKYFSGPDMKVVVPDKNIVSFKEALVFAFLGVLCFRNENNCLKSVTGAQKDSCGGTIHGKILL